MYISDSLTTTASDRLVSYIEVKLKGKLGAADILFH